MKYWLFDGEDVIGPFTPQEITARVGFSDSILVCPETQSEDENAWQIAANFQDFAPKGRVPNKEKSGKESAENATNSPTKNSSKSNTKVPLTVTSVPISHAENEEPVLPIKTTENKETAQEQTPQKQANANTSKEKAAADKSAQQTATPTMDTPLSKNKIDPSLWPELSLHSLPILGVSENTLPPLPAGDITFYVPSKEPAVWNQPQDNPAPEAAPKEQPATAPKNSVEKGKQPPQGTTPTKKEQPSKQAAPANNTPTQTKKSPIKKIPVQKPAQKAPTVKLKRPPVPAPLPAAIPEDAPEDFFAQTLSPFTQIPTELVQAQDKESIARIIQNPVPLPQEPDDFIPQKPSSSSGTKFLLFVGIFLTIVFLLTIAGCWLARSRYLSKASRTSSAPTTVTQTVPSKKTVAIPTGSAKTSALKTRPDISVPPPAASVPPLQEKALDIVKNYKLSSNRGTIEEYFNKLYASQLSQGYQASWSAEPLHKSTYIVKYRLTKTRTEPVMYVFQVDATEGKLTGALNNITLDLVGKI